VPHPLTRRATLGGLAALVASAASGCTGPDPSRAAPGTPTPSSTPSTPRTTSTAAAHRPVRDPDVALAATVLHDEQTVLDRVLATVHAHPRLAGPLAGARSAHRAHVDLLRKAVPDGAVSTRPPPHTPSVPATPAGALTALAHAEEQLARQGRRHALDARSGPFARVLASMAAAAAQQAARVAAAADRR
jgi:hypothetical protein